MWGVDFPAHLVRTMPAIKLKYISSVSSEDPVSNWYVSENCHGVNLYSQMSSNECAALQ